MSDAKNLTSATVLCRNSQGTPITANILRLGRYNVTFEVYNPYSILQLSEVLQGFQIRLNERVIYSGAAIVSGLVNTGVLLVCEVDLRDCWIDVDFLSDREGTKPLTVQFSEFFDDWKATNQVDSEFRVRTSDMQSLLVGLQRWMEQVDLGIRTTTSVDWAEAENETLKTLSPQLLEQVHPIMASFEKAARSISPDDQAHHKFFFRRQVHPLVLCSPFAHRTFYKPLGYAGDYEMVKMMLGNPYQGASLFAKSVNFVFLETPPVRAHRNRIIYLTKQLNEAVERADGKRIRILNLGCGPAQEIQNFISNHENSSLCDFTLLDFNDETIAFTTSKLDELKTKYNRDTEIQIIKRSVHQLLKQSATGDTDMQWESYDLVYCAGLYDYLSQKVCCRLTDIFTLLTKQGGRTIVTNVAADHPSIAWMEYLLEWNLIYRTNDDMNSLVPDAPHAHQTKLSADETGVNLFLEINKVGQLTPVT
jgi:extracellular factor (EF) 3-hydroxypalmitic acid methyl ester biosynthesis protein